MSTHKIFPKVISLEQVKGIEPSPQPWQGRVLTVILHLLERVMGIEPTYPAWKAGVLADVLHPHKRQFLCKVEIAKQSKRG